MSWEQYRDVMEKDAIKIDDIATEDAYFMATHMPFSQLEVYDEGRSSSTPKLMSEEEVFQNLIYNPHDEHRMIIVRGDNGTGKSHLIRYLKAKLENSSSTIYNPEKEQLIFLRRLNNSVRGVFSQLVEQKVIKDPEIEEKLKKFISSTDSKDEDAFKNDILYSYIAAVSSDNTGRVYPALICRNIASYLSDSRVQQHLLREDGAISKCYKIITSPSNQVLKVSAIFTEDDFNIKKIIRAVVKQGDPQASDFASELMDNEDELNKLIHYLNTFTREVVQRCADVSSESAKSVFEQLRRDLKKQDKNLTLFIEDFTGFTGIDSELITALSIEHGGEYEDLCRVTSIIGITNDYYDQFRDNFTDRVTHEINVTDRSYGTDNFLIEMSARYLNAIYCNPSLIREWYNSGADILEIPISNFTAPCDWENVKIGNHETTLYPFNSKALVSLYNDLPVKNPRTFLKNVIRAQLKEYFDGKIYNENWNFPLNPANKDMKQDQHSSSIDRLDGMPSEDKKRLKNVFALWGDGTAAGVRHQDGTVTYGGINKIFLDDIGLSAFNGIGKILDKTSGQTVMHDTESKIIDLEENNLKNNSDKISVKSQPVDGNTRDYIKFKQDINDWYNNGTELKYHPDYRERLKTFIVGDRGTCGAINWQDLGIPAYIAYERLSDLGCYYIEGQDMNATDDKIIVYMKRNAESRDALRALVEMRYAKGWDFEGSGYYQQRLITWLERNKEDIIKNVISSGENNEQLPVLEWCMTLQYLKAMILGHKIDTSTPLKTVESLFMEIDKDESIKRETKEWNNLVQFVSNKKPQFDSAFMLLKNSSLTTMGAINKSKNLDSSKFYRTNELLDAVEQLNRKAWNLESELPENPPQNHILYNPAVLLKNLYFRIKEVVEVERVEANNVISKIEQYVGKINEENLISTLSSIQDMFSKFQKNGIIGYTELKIRFEKEPKKRAKKILHEINILTDMDCTDPVVSLTKFSGNSLNYLSDFLRDIQEIERIAQKEEEKANNYIKTIFFSDKLNTLSEDISSKLKELYNRVDD